ncbi:DUF4268 domain-containing protein [Maribacter chungangensis]|uniref:DUF4268 domain-containing protein n=1 Tax=Maribacter chungangensis TaxID=1069117 RepID=A0ABW3B5P2_9FLAO
MFSKEESRKLREEFWIAFGKSYPRKWLLYKTGIKGINLKFHFDLKKAIVSLDVEGDLEQRIENWEKIISLKSMLLNEYVPEAIFKDEYFLGNGKEISRVYLVKLDVSIHNKNTWQETMIFFNETMSKLESFFMEYEDILK